MASDKHLNIICYLAIFLALLITALLVVGKCAGSSWTKAEEEKSDRFSTAERDASWDSSRAEKIVLSGRETRILGNGGYMDDGNLYLTQPGDYILSGELTDGSVIVSAQKNDEIRILLDGVSLQCQDGAAFLVEQAKKVYLTLADGSENRIVTDGSNAGDNDSIDGALYSRDDLAINGSGTLFITSSGKHALVCNDSLSVVGGKLSISAPQDGIHVNDSVRLSGADITITAGDDGITVSNDEQNGSFYMESGLVSILSCYEGIEATDISIAGGSVNIAPEDDGINAAGSGDTPVICITGGDISIVNASGRDADGLDSNGDIIISGGNLFISLNADSTNCPIDCGSETGGSARISGGTVIAAGAGRMAEGFDSSSEQEFILYHTDLFPAGTAFALSDSNGKTLLSGELPCSFSSLLLSAPTLEKGKTYLLSIGEQTEEVTTGADLNDAVNAPRMNTAPGQGEDMKKMPLPPNDGTMMPKRDRKNMTEEAPGRIWDHNMDRGFSPDMKNGGRTAEDSAFLSPDTVLLLALSAVLLLFFLVIVRLFPDRT